MSVDFGWLDTNIFVHALHLRGSQYPRCRAILDAIGAGEATGWMAPIVVHELTYVLKRQPQFGAVSDIHQFIRDMLLAPGMRAHDTSGLLEALARWATEGIGFADAWLAVLARRQGIPVCSANRLHFRDTENSFG